MTVNGLQLRNSWDEMGADYLLITKISENKIGRNLASKNQDS
jgi:hypothetical protein